MKMNTPQDYGSPSPPPALGSALNPGSNAVRIFTQAVGSEQPDGSTAPYVTVPHVCSSDTVDRSKESHPPSLDARSGVKCKSKIHCSHVVSLVSTENPLGVAGGGVGHPSSDSCEDSPRQCVGVHRKCGLDEHSSMPPTSAHHSRLLTLSGIDSALRQIDSVSSSEFRKNKNRERRSRQRERKKNEPRNFHSSVLVSSSPPAPAPSGSCFPDNPNDPPLPPDFPPPPPDHVGQVGDDLPHIQEYKLYKPDTNCLGWFCGLTNAISPWFCVGDDAAAYSIGYRSYDLVELNSEHVLSVMSELAGMRVGNNFAVDKARYICSSKGYDIHNLPRYMCQRLQLMRVIDNSYGMSESTVQLGSLNSITPVSHTWGYFAN